MVVPPKHPKMIIFSRKTMVVGYHHFRKPPYKYIYIYISFRIVYGSLSINPMCQVYLHWISPSCPPSPSNKTYGWCCFKYLLCSPLFGDIFFCGRFAFWRIFFQMGWFNHQLFKTDQPHLRKWWSIQLLTPSFYSTLDVCKGAACFRWESLGF